MRPGWLAVCWLVAAPLTAWAQAPADTVINPLRNDPAATTAGSRTFAAACSACHGPSASGGRGPALNTGHLSHVDTDEDLFTVIHGGIAAGGMPAFDALPTNEIWQLVSYIRSLSSAPRNAAGGPSGTDEAAAIGKELFFGRGGCSACHEINGAGALLAADLSAIGAQGTEAIRAGMQHLTARSPVVLDTVSEDGEAVRGVVLAEDSFDLILRRLDGKLARLDRRTLRSTVPVAGGLAPLGSLSGSDTETLLAYLSRQTRRAVDGAIAPHDPDVLEAARIVRAGDEPQNWLTYWGDYAGRHFSELSQINRDNVSQLQARWAAPLPGGAALQTMPLVVDGIMYVSAPGSVVALDAKSGLQIWKFTRKQDVVNPYQINPNNRGVAVLGGRVFVGTLDNLLIAIDARSGRELWERRIADTLEGYTLTAAPLAVDDGVVVGVGCGEYGVRGFLDFYEAATGARRWRFETIPGPGAPGHGSWPGESWRRGGGGTWLTGSYDPSLKLLYWAVGNPAPSYNWTVRAGDNLYTDSVLALDPRNGTLKWTYQFTPNDSHDWDSAQDLVLADRMLKGRLRKLLLHADRNGFFYMLDRTNGEFVMARPFVRQTWNDGFDAKGRPRVRPDSVATAEGQRVFPTTSATNFQAPSYDQRSGAFYLQFRDAEGFAAFGAPDFERGKTYLSARRAAPPAPSVPALYGIRSLDAEGQTRWTFPLTRFAAPAGVLATRGGLVFAATAEGVLIALDADAGTALWHFRAGGSISASPVAYAVDGRQYVAVAAGNSIYGFSLP